MASDDVLHCLPVSHKTYAECIRGNVTLCKSDQTPFETKHYEPSLCSIKMPIKGLYFFGITNWVKHEPVYVKYMYLNPVTGALKVFTVSQRNASVI